MGLDDRAHAGPVVMSSGDPNRRMGKQRSDDVGLRRGQCSDQRRCTVAEAMRRYTHAEAPLADECNPLAEDVGSVRKPRPGDPDSPTAERRLDEDRAMVIEIDPKRFGSRARQHCLDGPPAFRPLRLDPDRVAFTTGGQCLAEGQQREVSNAKRQMDECHDRSPVPRAHGAPRDRQSRRRLRLLEQLCANPRRSSAETASDARNGYP